ncbi:MULTISPECIES: hypothetical protein [Bradyrhizobium]|uniref:hypothetical protein n=1 Tax=Bradyrhizobium elkanii TaxID=29448 RepID=UPI0027156075|nr:hypothetical protein [Bradyrhizobium elkanii]WLA44963.1 hypothetical protein QIH80_23785 [Bradyrhizobium elkanii]WLB84908.1 hypothetical protein QIH83_21110 [Bradyrhizobium elkanii]
MIDKSQIAETEPAWFKPLLERYREEWEAGDTRSLAEAVALCGWNGLPLPEWCVEPVIAGLELFATHGGQGRSQSPASRLKAKQDHQLRYALVELELNCADASGKRPTLVQAYAAVAERLRGQNITARTVKASHDLIKKQKQTVK